MSDHETFIRMNQDPLVRKYFPALLSREESLAHIATIRKRIDEDGYGLFAAELKATGDFIGFIGLSHPGFITGNEPEVRRPKAHHQIFPENGLHFSEARFPDITAPCVEIGWRLDTPFWGQGLATEGAKACLDTAFQKWGMEEIYSWTAVHNLPSEKVMRRIGMTRQGTFAHPSIPADNWLCEHVLYRITNPNTTKNQHYQKIVST
jgi:RimJ/RimL family protein N-acetyltransferase